MNRDLFRRLAETRLEDASALLKARRFDAAYYLAGYAVECAFKACIAKQTREHDFPPRDTREIYTHNLEKLLSASGIREQFDFDRSQDSTLEDYWGVVKDWKEDRRYDLIESGSRAEAEALVEAMGDRDHGGLQCISKYW